MSTPSKIPRRAGWGVNEDQGGTAHNTMLDNLVARTNWLLDHATSSSTSTASSSTSSSGSSTTATTSASATISTLLNNSGGLVQKGYFYGLDSSGLLTLAKAGAVGIEPMLLSLALAGANESFAFATAGSCAVMLESGITAVTAGTWGWLSAKTPGAVTPVKPDVAMAWRVCTFTSNAISAAGLVQAWVNIFAQAGGSV